MKLKLPDTITTLHMRYLNPRGLMLLFTLELSAVTNLLTSLAGGAEPFKVYIVLLASLFYLVAASYAFAAEGLLLEQDEITKDFDSYRSNVQKRANDLAWWLAAQIAAVLYGTAMLLPKNG